VADAGFLFLIFVLLRILSMWSCLVSRMEDNIKICNKSFKSVDGIVQIFGNNTKKAKLHLRGN
jgi:hypothetical protein